MNVRTTSNAGANGVSTPTPTPDAGPKPHQFQPGDDPRRGPLFQPGPDPRRHKGGQMNKAALSFGRQIREMLIEEGLKETTSISGQEAKTRIQRVVERVYDEAELGQPWAVQTIFERVDGKITQPIENTGTVPVLVLKGDASMDDI